MTAGRPSSGFAMLLVLWTLIMLSAIALTLAASVSTEVRASQDSWNALQAERLAKSGHEVAAYLESRALGTAREDLVALPVEPVIAGLKYRVVFDIGNVDLVFEGENGRFDLAAASEENTAAFFGAWTGDSSRSREIAASIADWMDADDQPRDSGAESDWYLSRGYRPRNAGLGTADLSLIKGLAREDFVPSIINSDDTPGIRGSLTAAIAGVPAGNTVNPNYALPVVLRSLRGMTQDVLAGILEMRRQSIFTSAQDFRNRTGLEAESPLLTRLAFDRGIAPAILTVARLRDSARMSTERRVRRRGASIAVLLLIERSIPAS